VDANVNESRVIVVQRAATISAPAPINARSAVLYREKSKLLARLPKDAWDYNSALYWGEI
jgi:hypothetical protein